MKPNFKKGVNTMKKQMRFAAILASVSLLCNAFPTMSASALWYWGNEPTETFENEMQLLDDKGLILITDVDHQVYVKHISREINEVVTNAETGETETICRQIESDKLYCIIPRTNTLRYVLNEDANSEQAAQIVEKYFPNYQPSRDWSNDLTYEVSVSDIMVRTDENAEKLMQELAKESLISAFYTWGQTATYNEISYGDCLLTYCPPFSEMLYDWEKFGFDQEKVEQYLQENEIDCTVKKVVFDDSYYTVNGEKRNMVHYEIVPNGEMSIADQFLLGADIYEKLGYRIKLKYLVDESSAAVGRNALSVAGDVNLDCEQNISDAILLARYVNEDAVTISPQGLANADMDGNQLCSMEDVTLILRKIAKLD